MYDVWPTGCCLHPVDGDRTRLIEPGGVERSQLLAVWT